MIYKKQLFSIFYYLLILLLQYYVTNGQQSGNSDGDSTSNNEPKSITVKFITYSLDAQNKFYLQNITREFNDYSKREGLGIKIDQTLYSPDNVTINIDEYAMDMERRLRKETKLIDIIMVNAVYVYRFEDLVEDLRNYLSEDTIKFYSNKLTMGIGMKNNKLVGLPLYHDAGILYTNRKFMGKYGIHPPKTWDQLIEMAEMVIQKEKEQHNENVIGYLGNFPEAEALTGVAQEYLYTFRDSYNSSMPSYGSKNTYRALNKLREIKNRVSSNASFRLSQDSIVPTLIKGNVVFGRFWNGNIGPYLSSPLPGEKEETSGSWVNGYYLIMNKFIDENHKKATAKVMEFFLSKEFQAKHVMENSKISGSEALYEDEEFCGRYDCSFIKSLNFVSRVSDEITDNDESSLKFRNIFIDFLYNDVDTVETMKRLQYMSKIYSVGYTSSYGLAVTLIVIVVFVTFVVSFAVVFFDKFYFFLNMFEKKFWFISLLGLCIALSSVFFMMGEVTRLKCNLRIIFAIVGISFFLYPFVIKEIVCFPERNKISEFTSNYSLLIFIGLVVIDGILLSITYSITPYKVSKMNVENGKSYRYCKVKNNTFYLLISLMLFYKAIIVLLLCLLTFVEWNIDVVSKDIRTFSISLYLNIILVIIYGMMKLLNFKDMYATVSLNFGMLLIFAISNQFILIWLTMYKELSKRNNTSILKFRKTSKIEQQMEHKLSTSSGEKMNLKSKLIKYHYHSSNMEVYSNSGNRSNRSNSKSISTGSKDPIPYSNIATDQQTSVSMTTGITNTTNITNVTNVSTLSTLNETEAMEDEGSYA